VYCYISLFGKNIEFLFDKNQNTLSNLESLDNSWRTVPWMWRLHVHCYVRLLAPNKTWTTCYTCYIIKTLYEWFTNISNSYYCYYMYIDVCYKRIHSSCIYCHMNLCHFDAINMINPADYPELFMSNSYHIYVNILWWFEYTDKPMILWI
jgi:hypothetical protein